MSQNEQAFTTIDPDQEDGTQLATRIDLRRDSYNSNHIGTLTPTYITPGGFWMRDNGNGYWNLMLARADGTSIAQWGIDATSGQSDIISESKGDARYGLTGSANIWKQSNTFEGQTYCEDILNVGPNDYSGVARTRYWRAAGTEILFDAMAANNTFTFRNNAASSAIISARIEGAGTTVNNGYSVITREKGDARYGRIWDTNAWQGVNFFNGAVYTENVLQTRRTGTDTQIEVGFNANRGSVHLAAQTTAGGGTWSMWGIGIGFGNSSGSRVYLNDGTGVNELKYRRTTGDISNIIHAFNLSNNGVRGFSTSSDGNNTNYPVGTVVTARVGTTAPAVRATATIRISGGQFRTDVGSGSALAGTWRAMGQSANDAGDAKYCSFERVA